MYREEQNKGYAFTLSICFERYADETGRHSTILNSYFLLLEDELLRI